MTVSSAGFSDLCLFCVQRTLRSLAVPTAKSWRRPSWPCSRTRIGTCASLPAWIPTKAWWIRLPWFDTGTSTVQSQPTCLSTYLSDWCTVSQTCSTSKLNRPPHTPTPIICLLSRPGPMTTWESPQIFQHPLKTTTEVWACSLCGWERYSAHCIHDTKCVFWVIQRMSGTQRLAAPHCRSCCI